VNPSLFGDTQTRLFTYWTVRSEPFRCFFFHSSF